MSSDTPKKTCCDMLRKVAIGIAKVYTESECGLSDSVMMDFHDFDYKSPTNLPVAAALAFKFCPWCGVRRERDSQRRTTEVIRHINREVDDDPGESWKKGDQTDDGE